MFATSLLGIAIEQAARAVALPGNRERAVRSVAGLFAAAAFVSFYVV